MKRAGAVRCPGPGRGYYRQKGALIAPNKAAIRRQPRLSSKPSLQRVSLKLTHPALGRSLSATSVVASFTSVVAFFTFSISRPLTLGRRSYPLPSASGGTRPLLVG